MKASLGILLFHLSHQCPPSTGKKPAWCKTIPGDDGAGKTVDRCDRFPGLCWLDYLKQESHEKWERYYDKLQSEVRGE